LSIEMAFRCPTCHAPITCSSCPHFGVSRTLSEITYTCRLKGIDLVKHLANPELTFEFYYWCPDHPLIAPLLEAKVT